MVTIPTSTSSKVGNGVAPLKRSLFNKPSWSKPQALVNETELFHRSNQTYVDLAAEADQQRKKKQARKERERLKHLENGERAEKRQRLSQSEEEDDSDSASERTSHHSEEDRALTGDTQNETINVTPTVSSAKPETSSRSLLKRYETDLATKRSEIVNKQQAPSAHVIDLEEDDDQPLEDGLGSEARASAPAQASVEEDEPVSDEEFPELARQAREKARRKRLEEDIVSATPDPPSVSQEGYLQRSQSSHHPTPPPSVDPIVQILITSTIPNTQPLIVSRKVSQRLKDVRLAWTERQQFSSDFSAKVFLTWRRKRLFDVTSCKSLGIVAGPNGGVLVDGDYVGDDEGRIHMEAMTSEIFEACKKAKREEADDEKVACEDEPVIQEEKKEAQVRIICKAKGFDDFKLIVKPSTLISKICHAFRTQNRIDGGKEVYLLFDGDKLSPQGTIGDTEISDMDTLDVFVK